MSKKTFFLIALIAFLLLGSSSMQLPGRIQASAKADSQIPPSTLEYLLAQQQADGGLPGLSGVSDPSTTARALLALRGLQLEADILTNSDGISARTYLAENYPLYVYDNNGLLYPASAGLVLAAQPQIDKQTSPLAAAILAVLQPDGSFATKASSDFVSGAASDSNQAFSLLGLSAAGVSIPSEAVQYLLDRQMDDGTWDNGFGSDPDTTAVAVIALLSSGQVKNDHPAIVKALDYFRTTQLDNGAWRPAWDSGDLNVDTSGWITLAIITAGEDLAKWSRNGQSPSEAILTQLQPDGSIGGEYVNVYSTVEALLGLAKGPLFSIVPPQPAATDTQMPQDSEPAVSRAGLVVTMADGSSLLRCVEFQEQAISGFDLLTASGLTLETAVDPLRGMAVCSIEAEGCPGSSCFCDMPNYWSYWHLQEGSWSYAGSGAGTSAVSDGAVEGWSWGEGTEPAIVDFDQICGSESTLYLPALAGQSSTPIAQSTSDNKILLPAIGNPTQQNEVQPLNYLLYGTFIFILLLLLIIFVVIKKKKQ